MTVNTKQLVEASAEIVTVVTVKKGDVYKRLESSSTYNEAKLKYGIVIDVLHNGEDAAIQALEYDLEYGSFKVAKKVFDTGSMPKIFKTDPGEFEGHLAELTQHLNAARKLKLDELATIDEQLALVATLSGTELTESTTAPFVLEPAAAEEVQA